MELPHNTVAPEGFRLSTSVTYRCVLAVDREVVTWFAARLQTGRRKAPHPQGYAGPGLLLPGGDGVAVAFRRDPDEPTDRWPTVIGIWQGAVHER